VIDMKNLKIICISTIAILVLTGIPMTALLQTEKTGDINDSPLFKFRTSQTTKTTNQIITNYLHNNQTILIPAKIIKGLNHLFIGGSSTCYSMCDCQFLSD